MARLVELADKLNISTAVQLDASGRPEMEEEGEAMVASYTGVGLLLGGDTDAGAGQLHLTTRRVVWRADAAPQPCLSLGYRQIVMHAVSRDPEAHAKPCLYLQLDEGSEDMMAGGDEEDEEEAEEELCAEVRLVPGEEAALEEIFKHMCDCAALNPDSVVEGEDEGNFFFDQAEVMAGVPPEVRAALLAAEMEEGLGMEEGEEEEEEGELGGDPGRFADAKDEEEEEEDGTPAGAPQNSRHH